MSLSGCLIEFLPVCIWQSALTTENAFNLGTLTSPELCSCQVFEGKILIFYAANVMTFTSVCRALSRAVQYKFTVGICWSWMVRIPPS